MQKRFKFPDGSVELYAEKVNNRGLCAIAQAESLRYKLLGGLAVRRCATQNLCRCLCRLSISGPRTRSPGVQNLCHARISTLDMFP